MFCAARPVPLALEKKVASTLKDLVAMGVLSPCDTGDANASPVV